MIERNQRKQVNKSKHSFHNRIKTNPCFSANDAQDQELGLLINMKSSGITTLKSQIQKKDKIIGQENAQIIDPGLSNEIKRTNPISSQDKNTLKAHIPQYSTFEENKDEQIKYSHFSTKICTICDNNRNLRKVIMKNLKKKYLTSIESYNNKVINDIIYNENTNIVSVFKDYLIYDDISEFLKRYYSYSEAKQRLPKTFDFYEKYSQVFPNYFILPENKYMFKNIEHKQKVIDDQQKLKEDLEKKKEGDQEKEHNNIFTPSFFADASLDTKSKETQMKSYLKMNEQEKSISYSTIKNDAMNIKDIVEDFISQDSKSLINSTQEINCLKGQDPPLNWHIEEIKKCKPCHVRAKSDVIQKCNFEISPIEKTENNTMDKRQKITASPPLIIKDGIIYPPPKAKILESLSRNTKDIKGGKAFVTFKEVWGTPNKRIGKESNGNSLALQYPTFKARYAAPFSITDQLSSKSLGKKSKNSRGDSEDTKGHLPISLRVTAAETIPSRTDKLSNLTEHLTEVGHEFVRINGKSIKSVSKHNKVKSFPGPCPTIWTDAQKIKKLTEAKYKQTQLNVNLPVAIKRVDKRSISVTNRNNEAQIALLQNIYDVKFIDRNKGRNEKALIINTQKIGKIVNSEKTLKISKTRKSEQKQKFKSEFLNTLQKKNSNNNHK